MRPLPEFSGGVTGEWARSDRSFATPAATIGTFTASARCPDSPLQLKEQEMINKDQVGGAMKQTKGAVKEAAGKATGNRQTEAEGKADKITGKVQKGFGDVKEKIKGSL